MADGGADGTGRVLEVTHEVVVGACRCLEGSSVCRLDCLVEVTKLVRKRVRTPMVHSILVSGVHMAIVLIDYKLDRNYYLNWTF